MLRSFALLMSLTAAPTALAAQGFPGCARPVVTSKDDLVRSLGALRYSSDPDLRAAALAALGQPVVTWALEIAADSAGHVPLEARAMAFQVLRFARWRPAVRRLTELAQPLRGSWVVWNGALSALSTYPYPELVPFWRELLSFPRRNVRELALLGLARTGTPTDMLSIREATHQEHDPEMLGLIARAESLLAIPVVLRSERWFAGPPDTTGRFVPSAQWLGRAMPELCGAGKR